jgi:hypothetical protein
MAMARTNMYSLREVLKSLYDEAQTQGWRKRVTPEGVQWFCPDCEKEAQ